MRHNNPQQGQGRDGGPGTMRHGGAAGGHHVVANGTREDPSAIDRGGGAGDDGGADLFPASGLVSSSDEYYPTVAINALMRVGGLVVEER